MVVQSVPSWWSKAWEHAASSRAGGPGHGGRTGFPTAVGCVPVEVMTARVASKRNPSTLRKPLSKLLVLFVMTRSQNLANGGGCS